MIDDFIEQIAIYGEEGIHLRIGKLFMTSQLWDLYENNILTHAQMDELLEVLYTLWIDSDDTTVESLTVPVYTLFMEDPEVQFEFVITTLATDPEQFYYENGSDLY